MKSGSVLSGNTDSRTIRLKYGNTNTFFVSGHDSGLLVDTDYAGTLQLFYRAIKGSGIEVGDITYILATHYHPDHVGLIGELMRQGVKLLLIDAQRDAVHFSDGIFAKDRLPFLPIDKVQATVISCGESRAILLDRLGIAGEIIRTPSHSEDSVSLVLDNGDCFVGDLEPLEYLEAYTENAALKSDWEQLLSFRPRRIFHAHMPEKILS